MSENKNTIDEGRARDFEKEKEVIKNSREASDNDIKNAGEFSGINNSLSQAIFGQGINSETPQISEVDTLFKNNRWYLLSNMRQVLSEIYIEHGLIQTVIDVPVDDGLRGDIDIITSQLEPDQIEELKYVMEEKADKAILGQAMKWNRLFGGAGIIINTTQDASEKLDINNFKEGDLLEFIAVDMWELFHDMQATSDSHQEYGKPLKIAETYNYYGEKIHNSKVMNLRGIEAPSFVRPRLRGWGFSVVESMVRSVNQYLKATNLSFEILDEFKLDIYKIKGMTATLLNPDGAKKVYDRIALANSQKNYQNAIAMDAEDDYVQKQLSFAGISETMDGIRKQIASDLRMPLSKLFGISSAGFSSGEDDIENYNGMVESQIRGKAKFHYLKMVKLRCIQLFGYAPDDLKIEFQSLRVLSSEQEENVKSQKFSRLLQAKQAGEITVEEFRSGINKDNLLGIKLEDDENIIDEIKSTKAAMTKEEVAAPTAPNSTTTAQPAPEAKT